MVQQHLLRAYQEFLKIAHSSQRPEMLGEARNAAVNVYHFDPKLLDDALSEKVARPVPPSPVFHIYGKKFLEETTPRPSR